MRHDLYLHLAGKSVLDDLLVEVEAVRNKLDRVSTRQEELMADISGVNAQLTALTAAVNALIAKVQQGGTPTQADLDAVAAQMKTLTDQANATAGVTPPA